MGLAVVHGLVVPGSKVRRTTGSSCEKDVRPGLHRAASKSSDCVSALAAEITCAARHCFCSLSAFIWASFMRTCRGPDVPAVIHLQTCRCTRCSGSCTRTLYALGLQAANARTSGYRWKLSTCRWWRWWWSSSSRTGAWLARYVDRRASPAQVGGTLKRHAVLQLPPPRLTTLTGHVDCARPRRSRPGRSCAVAVQVAFV